MVLPSPAAQALPGRFLGASRESPRTGESPFQCHVGDAIPGFAGAGLSAPQKRFCVMGDGIFYLYFSLSNLR